MNGIIFILLEIESNFRETEKLQKLLKIECDKNIEYENNISNLKLEMKILSDELESFRDDKTRISVIEGDILALKEQTHMQSGI